MAIGTHHYQVRMHGRLEEQGKQWLTCGLLKLAKRLLQLGQRLIQLWVLAAQGQLRRCQLCIRQMQLSSHADLVLPPSWHALMINKSALGITHIQGRFEG